VSDNPALLKGVNMVEGRVTYPAVAEAFGMEYVPASTFLAEPAGVA
jgi:alanine dehydrogenase